MPRFAPEQYTYEIEGGVGYRMDALTGLVERTMPGGGYVDASQVQVNDLADSALVSKLNKAALDDWAQVLPPTADAEYKRKVVNGRAFVFDHTAPYFWTSTDGLSWSRIKVASKTAYGIHDIAWDGTYWLAIGIDSTLKGAELHRSPDLAKWEQITNVGPFVSPTPSGADHGVIASDPATGLTLFVRHATTGATATAWWSRDGFNTVANSYALSDIAGVNSVSFSQPTYALFDGARFVVGAHGNDDHKIWEATGQNITDVSFPVGFPSGFKASTLAHFRGKVYAFSYGGGYGYYVRHADGSWKHYEHATVYIENGFGISQTADGVMFAKGVPGLVATTDGITWSRLIGKLPGNNGTAPLAIKDVLTVADTTTGTYVLRELI